VAALVSNQKADATNVAIPVDTPKPKKRKADHNDGHSSVADRGPDMPALATPAKDENLVPEIASQPRKDSSVTKGSKNDMTTQSAAANGTAPLTMGKLHPSTNVSFAVDGKPEGTISGKRYKLYKEATTIESAYALGARKEDLRFDLSKGLMRLVDHPLQSCTPQPNVCKTKNPKDPNAPKKGPCAYFIFGAEKRSAIVEELGTNDIRRVSKRTGELWKALDAAGRAEYVAKANVNSEAPKQEKGAEASTTTIDAVAATADDDARNSKTQENAADAVGATADDDATNAKAQESVADAVADGGAGQMEESTTVS
jgi:hypothetical protein